MLILCMVVVWAIRVVVNRNRLRRLECFDMAFTLMPFVKNNINAVCEK